MKICNKCNKTKELIEFSKKKDSKDGLRHVCKECRRLESKEWYQNNKERKAETTKAWRKANKEKVLELSRKWWKNHPEKRYEKHKRFHKNNPHKNALYVSERRARKLKATPAWLTEEHKFMLEEIYDLRRLRTELTGVEHHVDHIVPLKGKTCCGLHVPWNLQVIPASENLSKSNSISDSRRTLCHV